MKKLNSNSNSLNLKNQNSNSLTLQKLNSNSNSSITCERIQIQSNPAFYTKDSKRILLFAPSKSQMCMSASQSGPARGGLGGTSYLGPGLGGSGSRGPKQFRFPRIKFWYGTIKP